MIRESCQLRRVEEQRGWLRDRYCVAWQIIPKQLEELCGRHDPALARAETEAMLEMVKIDAAALERAVGPAGKGKEASHEHARGRAAGPAGETAERGRMRFPNESAEYRAARTPLLADEIELRRHLERVAQQRRALPPGGEVNGDYRIDS